MIITLEDQIKTIKITTAEILEKELILTVQILLITTKEVQETIPTTMYAPTEELTQAGPVALLEEPLLDPTQEEEDKNYFPQKSLSLKYERLFFMHYQLFLSLECKMSFNFFLYPLFCVLHPKPIITRW